MLNKSSLVKNKLDFFKDEISLEREASLDKLNTGCLLVLQVLRAKYSDITWPKIAHLQSHNLLMLT